MVSPGLIAGIIGCLCISGCCCVGCMSQLQNRSQNQPGQQQPLQTQPQQQSFNPGTGCCGSSTSPTQMSQLQSLQRAALIQQDRTDRLEAYIIQQRQMAVENLLNGNAVAQTPPLAPVLTQPTAVQIPSAPMSQPTLQMPPRALILSPPSIMQPQPVQIPGQPYAGMPLYIIQ